MLHTNDHIEVANDTADDSEWVKAYSFNVFSKHSLADTIFNFLCMQTEGLEPWWIAINYITRTFWYLYNKDSVIMLTAVGFIHFGQIIIPQITAVVEHNTMSLCKRQPPWTIGYMNS